MSFVIGHRGAAGHAPENTLFSFEKAIELGVDAVELDVYCCKSGELVVMHDPTIDRTTDGIGAVSELTLEELEKRKCAQNQIIPTLVQVFDLVSRRCIVNVELKGPSTARPVANLIEKYVREKGWLYDDFIVSSFDHHELLRFHEFVPEVKTGALLEAIPISYAAFAEEAKASYAIIYYETMNQEFVDDAHRRGLKVFVYTLNEPEDILDMRNLGVDGFISNYPERVR